MATLWTPDSAALDQQSAHKADLARAFEATIGQLAYWNRELKQIDADLQLVKAREDAKMPGLKPGYFHIIRYVPGSPPSVWVHEGPNGEFREPDSGMLESLARGDMWSDRSRREQERRAKHLQAAADRERVREQNERREELFDRMKAAWNPGVRITKDVT